ncbi:[FeFe] hydrogenase, group A [Hornefia butyriciproducens]|uniref:[FeFe] hydrogenase, group A n=1 Tax=Hornefia butyriciproducens TaxID=2652293 RepID=UPI002A90E3A4|nr:[FeFe] hydrogenase, group A [Hornefia butyriciproducens]MDY6211639.1 [FeFe] hydrogenase, group A [Hornefia butyriciproducens]
MVNLRINGIALSVQEGTTIMNAAHSAGIDIPHLCYWEGLNEIGACRICVVEVAGMDKLLSACNTEVKEGMEILTNSPRVRLSRKTNVQLILSEHDCQCATCTRSGNCALQTIAKNLGIANPIYKDITEKFRWNRHFPLIRNSSKCIKCMRCIQVCDDIQDLHVWEMVGTAQRTSVGVRNGVRMDEARCSLCGQCITHCPVGALRERNDMDEVLDALADPDKITMVQFAPAVRVAWGEKAGLHRVEQTTGKLVAALKQIGFDYVFDTVYSADMTIMEEGSELIKRMGDKEKYSWPMFTSCCSGWLRFVKSEFPCFLPNLSTAKSPQQMFGALAKTYMAEKLGVDPARIVSVSLMPCTAKKYEADVEQVNGSGFKDVDIVLTTRELDNLILADGINAGELKEMPFDSFFGEGTGAGVIFGATGGVMEAALRTAYFLITKENPPADAFKNVRGMNGWKEATFTVAGTHMKVAVANGLGNARRLLNAIKAGAVEYDFVEIMACPGGCAGGGGQPIHDGREMAEIRGGELYNIDSTLPRRFSHENPTVQLTYREYLGEPLSRRAHQLLHTEVEGWDLTPETMKQ